VPQAGETLTGDHFETIPGGKGANQAAAVGRLGCPVAMLGCVGADAFGEALRHNLQRMGVDVSGVASVSSQPTGTATILVEGSGENRIVVVPGANASLSPAHIDAHEALIAQARFMLTQFETPLPTILHALRLARAHGLRTALNPAPAAPISDELYRLVDVLVVNETEASALSGVPVSDAASASRAASALQAKGPGIVAVTLGARGALLLSAEGLLDQPARPVEVVDTTAAGDAFVGALVVALRSALPLPDALRYAVSAGTLAVTQFGAQPSLPTAEAVEAFQLMHAGGSPQKG